MVKKNQRATAGFVRPQESSSIANDFRHFCRGRILLMLVGLGLGALRLLQLLTECLNSKLDLLPAACNCTVSNLHNNNNKISLRHNRNSINQTQTAERPSGCQDVLVRMHAWNNCWRQYMVQQQIFQERSAGLIPCTITGRGANGNESQVDLIGAPIYIIGNYAGQGFGRVVGHTVETCLVAFIFGRPCLLNLLPRDHYYTWRSFIQPNTLNWDPTILHTDPLVGHSLDSLTQLLPNAAHGEWGLEFDEKSFLQANPWVAPMQEKIDNANWMFLYHAGERNHANNSHKVLVSSNWGDAWFTRIDSNEILQSQYQCSTGVLRSMVQNAMYGPTDLLNHLHNARLEAAINSGMWNYDNSSASTATVPHPALQLLPQKDTVYGAIHLRTFFMMTDTDHPATVDDIVTKIRHCLLKSSQVVSEIIGEVPENWWLISDDPEVAKSVANGLGERQQIQLENLEINRNNPLYNQSFPIVSLYHNYSSMESSEHSGGDKATGLYGHHLMAGSVEDWIALHQSRIAIVGPGSAYADTGAQGSGKRGRYICGEDSNNGHLFTIFF
jgi:hypothetical protein